LLTGMKLRAKTTLFFGIFFIIVVSTVVVYIEYVVGDTLRKQTAHNFRIIAEQSEGTYFAFLGAMKTRALDWTSDAKIQDLSKRIISSEEGTADRAKLAEELGRYLKDKKMPYDKTILITDLLDHNGIVIASTKSERIGKNEKAEELYDANKFTETISAKFGEVFFGSIVFDDESPEPVIKVTVRVSAPSEDGTLVPIDAVLLIYFANTQDVSNALGMGLGTQALRTVERASSQAFLESYKTSNIFLVNRDHFIVTPSRYLQNVQLKQKAESFPVRKCFDEGEEISEEYDNYQGIRVLGASMCFKDNGLVLLVEIQKDEIFAPLYTLTRITIAGGLVVLVGALIVAFFFVRLPLLRIGDVVTVAKRVATGDFTVQVKVQTKDEIGYLASVFNTMIVSIRDARKDLELSKQEVEEKAKILEKDVSMHERQEKELEESKKVAVELLKESQQVGEKLKIESNRMQTVLESIGDALILIDGEYKIILANPQALKVFAMPREGLEGKDLREIMKLFKKHIEINPAEGPIEEMFLTKSVVVTTIEDEFALTTAFRADPLPITFSVAPLGGGLSGGVIVIHDTTEDHELNEAKSGFISVASHQLRTPLTSIRWYSEMLLSEDVGPLNEAQKDFMSEVHGGAERLYQTVDLLLGISRVESGKIKTEKQQIDLAVFTGEIAKELASQIDEKGVTLSVVAPDGDAVAVSLDPLTLRQVVLNMLSNAIRYTKPKNGIIEVAWKMNEANNEVVYSVSDNGIGIPKAAQDRVFSKFFRAENARAAVPDGSGLGLALVKELVESWGGRVWFETEEGNGTTFFFTVPFAPKG